MFYAEETEDVLVYRGRKSRLNVDDEFLMDFMTTAQTQEIKRRCFDQMTQKCGHISGVFSREMRERSSSLVTSGNKSLGNVNQLNKSTHGSGQALP